MSEKDNGGPAFPVERRSPQLSTDFDGMTLRDYFAAKAMQGWSANPLPQDSTIHDVAAWAYRQADAMLEARKQ